jgi:hypothetical protein
MTSMKLAKVPSQAKKILTVALMGSDSDREEIEEYFDVTHKKRGLTMTEFILTGIRSDRKRRAS